MSVLIITQNLLRRFLDSPVIGADDDAPELSHEGTRLLEILIDALEIRI